MFGVRFGAFRSAASDGPEVAEWHRHQLHELAESKPVASLASAGVAARVSGGSLHRALATRPADSPACRGRATGGPHIVAPPG